MNSPSFISVPVKELTTSLNDFQGRATAYASQTYNRIVNEVKAGTFNFSALPPIQIWKDSRTGKWVILAGHSRTAAFTDLAKGKYPIAKQYSPKDFEKIAAQIVTANTLEEAKKIALESNAGATQTEIENAKYAKELRGSLKRNEYIDKLKDLYGKNWVYVNELSYLNPNGKAMSMLVQLQNMSDQTQRLTIEKIASFLGAVREKIPALTDAHENELYDWLIKNISNDKTNSKNEFIANISARVMRLDFNPGEPLNLDRVATKTYIESNYEEQIAAKKKEIEEKQEEYKKERDRYLQAKLSIEEIETRLDPLDKLLLRLQRELRDLMLKKTDVQQAGKSILGLFDNANSNVPDSNEVKIKFEDKLKTLLDILRLNSNTAQQVAVQPPKTETPKLKKYNSLLIERPPVYGPLENRIIKYEYNALTGNVEGYNYPAPLFSQGIEAFYSRALTEDGFSLTQPENYKPFRSDILNVDYTGERTYKYELFTPFLLDQLDWWLNNFEERFLKKTIPLSKLYGYVPQKVKEMFGYHDVEMLKQLCETAVHIFTDYLIRVSLNEKEAYEKILFFYKHQPIIKWRSSYSISLQQYSTPIPIAYGMSRFCIPVAKFGERYLEPSAGTGLLTIGTPAPMWTVNEIDSERLLCLKFMGFTDTYSQDSNTPLPYGKVFDAVLTNPPFGNDTKLDFGGYKIKKLEHRMAAFALQCLKPDGRAAIVIGNNTTYDHDSGMITPFESDRVFFAYLYKYFNVVDIINIAGELYAKMGAGLDVRVILIDGAATLTSPKHPYFYKDIKNLPPEKRNSPVQIRDYDLLFQRFFYG